jgi:hypothetical protein
MLLQSLIINSIRGLRYAAFDIAESSEADIKLHKRVVRRRWAILGISLLFCVFLGWISWIVYDIVRVSRVPLIVVDESSLPYKQDFPVKEDGAIWIKLPNGKKVAFWGNFFHPDWGERPYKSPRRIWTQVSEVEKTSDRVKSYFQSGLDLARSKPEEKEYACFVDNYCIASECERIDDSVYKLSFTVRYAQKEEIAHLKKIYGSWPLYK